MTHPRAMMEDDFVTALRQHLEADPTASERWLIEVLMEIVDQAGDHPAVVKIINDRTLRAMQKAEAQRYGCR